MKGIKCNSNEVNAILAGDKSQIRLVIKPKPWHVVIDADFKKGNNIPKQGHDEKEIKCPHQIGDLVFVKESFWQYGGYDSGYDYDEPKFIGSYKITFSEEEANKPQTLCKAWKKRPAQHMKQHQSRITLRIKDISVERLCDISEEDARSEGFVNLRDSKPVKGGWCAIIHHDGSVIKSFREHWNATHKKPEEKWEANPWIWKIEVEVVK